ncbi:MAG: transposase [Candidatus Azobacteroides sp.]|nr:transposase [Candidatus Azobacteroides sp.]
MASEIKAIKCPQCGSTQQTEIRRNYFRCNSCRTEYFVNNENDITITHKYDIPNNTPQLKKTGITIAIVAGSIIFLSILSSLLFSHESKSNITANKEKTFKWDYDTRSFGFESINKQSIFVAVGTAQTNDRASDTKNLLAGFYDAISGKEIKKQELTISVKRNDDRNVEFRRFENGDCYCIFNKKKLLKVDRQYINIEEAPFNAYKEIQELDAGIAQIEFLYKDYGDGFKILTNEGKFIDYYPIIQKAFSAKEISDFRDKASTLPYNATVKTAFKFSGGTPDKIQLIKYKYKGAVGYPKNTPWFDRTDDGKIFIRGQGERFVSYADFMPGRLYFNSTVLAYNEQQVVISFRSSPAEDAPLFIQALDANTAQILWTTPVNDKIYVYDDSFITNSGYFIRGNIYNLFIDKNGKIINRFNPRNL